MGVKDALLLGRVEFAKRQRGRLCPQQLKGRQTDFVGSHTNFQTRKVSGFYNRAHIVGNVAEAILPPAQYLDALSTLTRPSVRSVTSLAKPVAA